MLSVIIWTYVVCVVSITSDLTLNCKVQLITFRLNLKAFPSILGEQNTLKHLYH